MYEEHAKKRGEARAAYVAAIFDEIAARFNALGDKHGKEPLDIAYHVLEREGFTEDSRIWDEVCNRVTFEIETVGLPEESAVTP